MDSTAKKAILDRLRRQLAYLESELEVSDDEEEITVIRCRIDDVEEAITKTEKEVK